MLYDKFTCSTQNPGLRRDYIGASDAPIIMEESPWMTPLQLYEIKLGIVEQAPPNSAMLRGIELESIAREELAKKLLCNLEPYRVFSKNTPFMMANIDAYSGLIKYACEIKCPVNAPTENKVPEKYYAQLQHTLYCLGWSCMVYYAWHPDGSYSQPVFEDLPYQKKLVEKEQEFYDRLKNCDPPPPTDRDYVCRDDMQWVSLTEEYKYLDETSKEIKRQLDECRERLINEAAGRPSRGNGLTLTKTKGREILDYKRLWEDCSSQITLEGGELTPYMKKGNLCWRITV